MKDTAVDIEVRQMSRNFVSNMKRLRSANNMSITGMALATDLDQKTIRRIEHARVSRGSSYEPRLRTVAKVAKATGCEIEDLLIQRM